MSGLSVSNLVQVSVSLSPQAAQGRSFGTLLVMGDSNVINGVQRFQTFLNFQSVVDEFGVDAPETEAAELFFEQSPQPTSLVIGRWFSSAAAAANDGGILTSAEQTLSNWTSITNGSFVILIDGVTKTLTGLDFSAQTNLNGVASVITTALSGAGVCTWNGSYFVITSATSGTGVQASGTITFTGQPTGGTDTITVNGLSIAFVSSSPSGNQVLVGSTDVDTAANLQAFLSASSNADLTPATYSRNGLIITVTYKTVGTGGNAFTLAKSSSAITLSASTLAGGAVASSVTAATAAGSGTDISAQLMLTAATLQALIPGFAAESPVAGLAAIINLTTAFYGIMFAATESITDQQNIDVANFVEAQELTFLFGVTVINTNVLSPLVSNDLASEFKLLGLNQAMTQYSSSSDYAIASLFGRAFSVDFTQANSTIVLMYKQQPGVAPEALSQSEASVLKAKNCNVFVQYENDTNIIQYGVVASGQFIDTIQGVDWLQDAVQTACYNVLFTTTTKVPQTDAGVNQLTSAIAQVCAQGVNNGFIAPGIWNGTPFGNLSQGQYLKLGYYIFAQPIALQSQADRATRVAPPIQVAVKLAGGIQTVNVLINVNS
jgi:Protein of unknown function (DUF3383)